MASDVAPESKADPLPHEVVAVRWVLDGIQGRLDKPSGPRPTLKQVELMIFDPRWILEMHLANGQTVTARALPNRSA
ncbi:MAG: hypothetical protein ACYDD1_18780 [Caulobacteraceae bacterium]